MKYRVKKAMLCMLAMVCGVCMLAGYASASSKDASWAFSGYQTAFNTEYRQKEDNSKSYCKSTEGQPVKVSTHSATSKAGASEIDNSESVRISPGNKHYFRLYQNNHNTYKFARMHLTRTIEDKAYNRGVWSPDSTQN